APLFGGRPTGNTPAPATPSPAAPGPAPAMPRADQGEDRPRLPARGGPAGELPARLPQRGGANEAQRQETARNAESAPQSGAGERPGLPAPSQGRPQLPQRTQNARAAQPQQSDEAAGGAQRPSWASGEDTAEQHRVRAEQDRPRGHEESVFAGGFDRPGANGGAPPEQAQPDPYARQDPLAPQGYAPQPVHDDTTELDIPIPANATAQTRTPIFEQMETNWFSRDPQSVEPAQAEPAPQQVRPSGAASPIAPQRQAGPGETGQQPQVSVGNGSANDELWRRAERLRTPAAGGVTTSGLPRRVPRANLVEGTAQQQPAQVSGPQVSRAPDAVRGRLTNLRRGIAQGRQAGGAPGSNDRGNRPTYQQER
ncbi:histidine kinase, partial [Streptomyces sp. XM4193]|nr:histidine kinase [Streptomyces sp. XM4193]